MVDNDFSVLPSPKPEDSIEPEDKAMAWMVRAREILSQAYESEEHHQEEGHFCTNCPWVKYHGAHEWDGWDKKARDLLDEPFPPGGFDPKDYSKHDLAKAAGKARKESPQEFFTRIMEKIGPDRYSMILAELLDTGAENTKLKVLQLMAQYGGMDLTNAADQITDAETRLGSFLLGGSDDDEVDDDEA